MFTKNVVLKNSQPETISQVGAFTMLVGVLTATGLAMTDFQTNANKDIGGTVLVIMLVVCFLILPVVVRASHATKFYTSDEKMVRQARRNTRIMWAILIIGIVIIHDCVFIAFLRLTM